MGFKSENVKLNIFKKIPEVEDNFQKLKTFVFLYFGVAVFVVKMLFLAFLDARNRSGT